MQNVGKALKLKLKLYIVTSLLTKGDDEYELDGGKYEKTGVENDYQGRLTPSRRQHRPEGKDDIEQ